MTYKRGDFLMGAAHPADRPGYPRRRDLKKGSFMTVDAPPGNAAKFDKATGSFTSFSDQQRDFGIDEIVRRLRLVKQQLDDQSRSIRKQRDARR